MFDKAIAAIAAAKRRGFRVTTNTTFFDQDDATSIRGVLDFLNDEVGVDSMQISPGFAYEKAPDQDHWLNVERTHALFREAFAGDRRKKWRLNHSPLFLDFLEGKVDFSCTAWGIPSYSVLGWQRPCYLMSDGYASSYRELIDTTPWEKYGRGRDERCGNCMAHCGYEPTAVVATSASLRESLRAAKRQPQAARNGAPAQLRCPQRRRRPSAGEVFLTGASGFVGSHVLAALLGRGYRVRALVRAPARPASGCRRGDRRPPLTRIARDRPPRLPVRGAHRRALLVLPSRPRGDRGGQHPRHRRTARGGTHRGRGALRRHVELVSARARMGFAAGARGQLGGAAPGRLHVSRVEAACRSARR